MNCVFWSGVVVRRPIFLPLGRMMTNDDSNSAVTCRTHTRSLWLLLKEVAGSLGKSGLVGTSNLFGLNHGVGEFDRCIDLVALRFVSAV